MQHALDRGDHITPPFDTVTEDEYREAEEKAADAIAHDLIRAEQEDDYGLLELFAYDYHRLQAVLRLAFRGAYMSRYLPNTYYQTQLDKDEMLVQEVLADHERELVKRFLP